MGGPQHRPSHQEGWDGRRASDETQATFRRMVEVARGTAVGQVLAWDGDKWGKIATGDSGDVLTSRGAGLEPRFTDRSSASSISAVDIGLLGGVMGAWSMEGDVEDRGPHGLDLDGGVGSVQYLTVGGKRCAYRPPNATWRRATHDSELALTDACTIHHLVFPLQVSDGSDPFYFSFMASGETEPDNVLYGLRTVNGASGDLARYFSENGAGVDSVHGFLLQPPVGAWALLTITRNAAGSSVSFYINGKVAGATPGAVTQPTGGGSAVFALYQRGGTAVHSYVGDTVVQEVEMSAADVLAVAAQVGVA